MDINIDKLLDSVILNPDDLEELKVGYVVKGVVTANFNDFSYVTVADLHCVLPISEVSYDPKPKNPKVGTAIEAVVIRISEEQGIMLSIKRLKQNPWDSIDELYKVGQRVNVKVKNITSYGAFVEFENHISGLIHRKELSIKKHFTPNEIVSVGQIVDAEIIEIDKDLHRIQLSMKKCVGNPWEHVADNYLIGQKYIRQVSSVLDYGAFIEMEPGVEALLHRSELGLKKSESIKKHISAGDTIEVEIQTLDVEAKKMSLKCIQLAKNEQPNLEE